MRRVFIGDIHGNYKGLEKLLLKLKIGVEDEFVFMGDYIDKGEDSRRVLDLLKDIKEIYPKTRFLCGNHELMFYQWLTGKNPTYIGTLEGVETVRNLVEENLIYSRGGLLYGEEDTWGMELIDNEIKNGLKKRYLDFMEDLEYIIEYPEQIVVHGGLNFSKEDPIKDTTDYEKVYIKGFVNGSPLSKKLIIGHTPMDNIAITSDEKIINVDTGSGIGGKLSALIYYKSKGLYVDGDGNNIAYD